MRGLRRERAPGRGGRGVAGPEASKAGPSEGWCPAMPGGCAALERSRHRAGRVVFAAERGARPGGPVRDRPRPQGGNSRECGRRSEWWARTPVAGPPFRGSSADPHPRGRARARPAGSLVLRAALAGQIRGAHRLRDRPAAHPPGCSAPQRGGPRHPRAGAARAPTPSPGRSPAPAPCRCRTDTRTAGAPAAVHPPAALPGPASGSGRISPPIRRRPRNSMPRNGHWPHSPGPAPPRRTPRRRARSGSPPASRRGVPRPPGRHGRAPRASRDCAGPP